MRIGCCFRFVVVVVVVVVVVSRQSVDEMKDLFDDFPGSSSCIRKGLLVADRFVFVDNECSNLASRLGCVDIDDSGHAG